MLTQENIDKAFEGTNFGNSHPLEVIYDTLAKIAVGWGTGSTATHVCESLGLLVRDKRMKKLYRLSKFGRDYLWERIGTFQPKCPECEGEYPHKMAGTHKYQCSECDHEW